ncbi:MAG: hemerythrin domain-containing protein [Armatimonadetes bacterium]|nr:hemerythrin domain-containing protein [Armatimonadota bacterium]
MEKYLEKSIKEVIKEFPKVSQILDEYNIGCAPCSIGSCMLKDIIAIHSLPIMREIEMMRKIEKVIYPKREVKMPLVNELTQGTSLFQEKKYSPPLKKLVAEHTLIKRYLELISKIIEDINAASRIDKDLILKGIDFIKSYADKFHHAKEERILFKYFDENLDIIKTMLKDHETARGYVKDLFEGLEKEDKIIIIENLNNYNLLLKEHIKKEDEILYLWMDRNLSAHQVGRLFAEFSDADKNIGEVETKKYEEFIFSLEERFLKKD